MSERMRINVYVDSKPWEFIGALSEQVGRNRSLVLRDLIQCCVDVLQAQIGNNLENDPILVRKAYNQFLDHCRLVTETLIKDKKAREEKEKIALSNQQNKQQKAKEKKAQKKKK